MKRRRHGFDDIVMFLTCVLVLVVNALILSVAVSAAAEDTPQQKCQKEYTKLLQSYVDQTEAPSVPDCKSMTDSQWYAINAKTDKLHNEITENFASSNR